MSLIKKNVHMNRLKGKVVNQITLDDDIIVPDKLPDIGNKITEHGCVVVDSVKISNNKISVEGNLKFKLMYRAESPEFEIHRLEGMIPFSEIVNMEGIEEGDAISVDMQTDDLNITVINSRKISVKAILTVTAMAENICDEEFVVDVEDEDVQYIKERIELAQIAMRKKDLIRVKEEIDLDTKKSNINEIIWSSTKLSSQNVRNMEDKISISGELQIFVLYTADEGPLQWMESTVPFSGVIEMPGCSEELVPNIEVKLGNYDIEAKPDYDGEMRVFQLDAIINISIKLYEEQSFEIVKDMYSPRVDIKQNTKKTQYEHLIMKNIAKCKVNEKVKVGNADSHIMQICSSTDEVKIDDVTIMEDGIMVEGAVVVTVLYICSDDSNPMACVKKNIPFTYKIDVTGVNEESVYNIRSVADQVQANMSGTDEIEIKCVIMLDCIVFDKIEKEILTGVTEEEYDMELISKMPGIVGYVVKKDDSLWSIAKKYYTTVDSIRKVNQLKGDEIKAGDMLLVVKKV